MRAFAALLLLLSASNVLGDQFFENHVLHGKHVKSVGIKDSFDDCVGACTGSCSAVSYNPDDGVCLMTLCGIVVLNKGHGWVTVAVGDPAIAGETVPVATHEWGMTDQCGLDSVGIFNSPSLALVNSVYRYSQSNRFGNAVYFPNANNQGGSYARSFGDGLIAAYNGASVSFSVAFYVYFVALPSPHSCLLEFFSGSAISWLYWIWPDPQHIHYHIYSPGKDSYAMVEWKITTGNWHHIAYSYDASAGTMTVLVNGTVVSTQVAGFVGPKVTFDSFYMGTRIIGGGVGGLNGAMYCMSFYNQTLSADMTKEIMRSCVDGKVRFADRRSDVFN